MTSETHGLDTGKPMSRDGALRCLLCADASASADHEWCAAAEGLVCDGCCLSLLQGDVMRLLSITANAGRVVTPEALFQACSQCERAHRQAAERLLSGETGDDTPAC